MAPPPGLQFKGPFIQPSQGPQALWTKWIFPPQRHKDQHILKLNIKYIKSIHLNVRFDIENRDHSSRPHPLPASLTFLTGPVTTTPSGWAPTWGSWLQSSAVITSDELRGLLLESKRRTAMGKDQIKGISKKPKMPKVAPPRMAFNSNRPKTTLIS